MHSETRKKKEKEKENGGSYNLFPFQTIVLQSFMIYLLS